MLPLHERKSAWDERVLLTHRECHDGIPYHQIIVDRVTKLWLALRTGPDGERVDTSFVKRKAKLILSAENFCIETILVVRIGVDRKNALSLSTQTVSATETVHLLRTVDGNLIETTNTIGRISRRFEHTHE